MTTWTDTAKEELEKYFDRVRPGLHSSGADAAEVIEDTRRQIEQEAAAEMDIVGWIIGARERVSPEKARELYYRVTGRPFNSVPAPRVRTARGDWTGLDDWSWDRDQGGDRVGARVNGLYLDSSRLDAVVEPDAATASTEWTLVFNNDGQRQAEARPQIILPAGGVVSRLTLWLNGEKREAAFGTRSQLRTTYERVAIRQRPDAVAVSACGPDCVLVQCFPVPPDGNTTKVRLGITAPLSLVDAAEGLLVLLCFAQWNFTLTDSLRHAVWIASCSESTDRSGGLPVRPCSHSKSRRDQTAFSNSSARLRRLDLYR